MVNKVDPRSMDLEVFGSPNHSEEEEATPRTMVEAQPNILEEPSPSNVVVGVFSERTSQMAALSPIKLLFCFWRK